MNLKNPIIGYAIASAAAYFIIVKPLLQSLNLMDTREEKDAARLQTQTEKTEFASDYWNPNYLKQAGTAYNVALFTEDAIKKYAEKLWKAKSPVNDDEEAIYAVFRAMRYKTQVSFLTYWFNRLYKKDLYTWLRDSVLNKEELATVLNITSKLPSGFFRK